MSKSMFGKQIYFSDFHDPNVEKETLIRTHIQEWTLLPNPEYNYAVDKTVSLINSIPVKFGCVYDLSPFKFEDPEINNAYANKLKQIHDFILGPANVNLYDSNGNNILTERHISTLRTITSEPASFLLLFNIKDDRGNYVYETNKIEYYVDDTGKVIIYQEPLNGGIIMTSKFSNDIRERDAIQFKYLELVEAPLLTRPNNSSKGGGMQDQYHRGKKRRTNRRRKTKRRRNTKRRQ